MASTLWSIERAASTSRPLTSSYALLTRCRRLRPRLVMSRKQRRRFGIPQTITFVTADYAQAHFEKPEADSYRLALAFRKIDGCWYLEHFSDASL